MSTSLSNVNEMQLIPFSGRPPQVNDFVQIIFNGKTFLTKITKIEGLMLVLFVFDADKDNNTTSLTWNGIDWLLPQNYKPSSVKFMVDQSSLSPLSVMPTGSVLTENKKDKIENKEIKNNEPSILTGHDLSDIEILLSSDHKSFMSLCSTNKALNKICNDPHYYNILYKPAFIKNVYPYLSDKTFVNLDNTNTNWRNLYMLYAQFLPILSLSTKDMSNEAEKLLIDLIQKGDFEKLILLYSIEPESIIFISKANKKYLETVTTNEMKENYIPIMDWIYSESQNMSRKYRDMDYDTTNNAKNDKIRYIKNDLYPSIKNYLTAFIRTNFYPGINRIVEYYDLDIYNIPDLYPALITGNIKMLDTIINIFANKRIYRMIENYQIEKLIKDWNASPDYERGLIYILKTLEYKDLIHPDFIEAAFESKNMLFLNLVSKMYPRKINGHLRLSEALKTNDYNIVKWAVENKFTLSSYDKIDNYKLSPEIKKLLSTDKR